ncbi:DNRLRE domain-containing protein [Herbidospora mongoliensis]|uniref:DNRLRE domain-containing protein n=1 Tax=Herbidospora mongoliensis TaxID=688067 RepID=UPI0008350E12
MLRNNIHVTSAHDEDSLADWLDEFLLSGTERGLTARSYLKFDMSYLPEGVIRSATLRLTGIGAPACGPAVGEGVQVRRVTGPWSDDFLHWETSPIRPTTAPRSPPRGSRDMPAGESAHRPSACDCLVDLHDHTSLPTGGRPEYAGKTPRGLKAGR